MHGSTNCDCQYDLYVYIKKKISVYQSLSLVGKSYLAQKKLMIFLNLNIGWDLSTYYLLSGQRH